MARRVRSEVGPSPATRRLRCRWDSLHRVDTRGGTAPGETLETNAHSKAISRTQQTTWGRWEPAQLKPRSASASIRIGMVG
eukprot:5260808-Pyramimonas_sp.AAC.1